MSAKKSNSTAGFTLVEIMAAIAILLVAILGTFAFRYNATLGARRADLQTTAARTALLLCESWRGADDPNAFDPTLLADTDSSSSLAVELAYEGPTCPSDFTLLGIYRVTVQDINYYATLSWKDVSTRLRALNIAVAWDLRGSGADYSQLTYRPFKLTTYFTD